jgi:hypothetical protein
LRSYRMRARSKAAGKGVFVFFIVRFDMGIIMAG